MPNSYDLAVAYRIYPKISDAASSFPCGHDKYRLSELCLRSFKESLKKLRVKVWVVLDGCPDEYANLFRKYFETQDLVLIALPGLGNQATFARQIDVLLEQDDSEVVYFAEDDYFYLPGQFSCMIDFLQQHKDVDFVSPYDHLDCYTMDLHRQPKWLAVHGGRHWRTAASTCLTFLTTRQTLKETQTVFRSYRRRSLDCSIWLSLTKRRVLNPFFFVRHLIREQFFSKIIAKSWLHCGRQILFGRKWKLWVPVPGVATHLDARALSPNVDWRALLEQAKNHTLEEISVANCG
jgi:glycosyltransferase involved in cell wall biosynthesis